MTLLIIGNNQQAEECKAKFGPAHQYIHTPEHPTAFAHADTVFDFVLCEAPEQVSFYERHSFDVVFIHSAVCTLKKMVSRYESRQTLFVGFNGLPTLLNRPLLEVCMQSADGAEKLSQVCAQLGTDYLKVPDQVGMVTARVIAMIVNEAYLTLEEGTATREDIDRAMKLGTNYPYGPFEWGDQMGLHNIRQVLQNLKHETGDSRYDICALLAKTTS